MKRFVLAATGLLFAMACTPDFAINYDCGEFGDCNSYDGYTSTTPTTVGPDVAPVCYTQSADRVFWLAPTGLLTIADKTLTQTSGSNYGYGPPTVSQCQLAVDATGLYATIPSRQGVVHTSIGGGIAFAGEPTTLGAVPTPSALALDDTFVYVGDWDSGRIHRFAKQPPSIGSTLDGGADGSAGDGGADGGALAEGVLGQGHLHPHDMIVADGFLYWLDDSGLRKMPVGGGPEIAILSRDTGSHLVIADGYAFWVANNAISFVALIGGVTGRVEVEDPNEATYADPYGDNQYVSQDTTVSPMSNTVTIGALTTFGSQIYVLGDHGIYAEKIASLVESKVQTFERLKETSGVPIDPGTATLLVDENTMFYRTRAADALQTALR